MSVLNRIAQGFNPGAGMVQGELYRQQTDRQNRLADLQERQFGLQERQTEMAEQKALAAMSEAQRKQVRETTMEFAKAAYWADTPEKWQQAIQSFQQRGMQIPGEYMTFTPDVRQRVIMESMTNAQMIDRMFPKPTTSQREYEAARSDPGFAAHLSDQVPQTNINMPQNESEYQKAFGSAMGKEDAKTITEGRGIVVAANKEIATLRRLESLFGGVETGAAAPTVQFLKRWGKDLGIDLESWGITDDTAPAEAGVAIANQLALEMRNPDSGAGMPGAMSDKDREFLQSIIPSLANTAEGRGMLIETRVALAKRRIQLAQITSQYIRDNGSSYGLEAHLQKYADENPLFEGKEWPTAAPATGQDPVNWSDLQ